MQPAHDQHAHNSLRRNAQQQAAEVLHEHSGSSVHFQQPGASLRAPQLLEDAYTSPPPAGNVSSGSETAPLDLQSARAGSQHHRTSLPSPVRPRSHSTDAGPGSQRHANHGIRTCSPHAAMSAGQHCAEATRVAVRNGAADVAASPSPQLHTAAGLAMHTSTSVAPQENYANEAQLSAKQAVEAACSNGRVSQGDQPGLSASAMQAGAEPDSCQHKAVDAAQLLQLARSAKGLGRQAHSAVAASKAPSKHHLPRIASRAAAMPAAADAANGPVGKPPQLATSATSNPKPRHSAAESELSCLPKPIQRSQQPHQRVASASVVDAPDAPPNAPQATQAAGERADHPRVPRGSSASVPVSPRVRTAAARMRARLQQRASMQLAQLNTSEEVPAAARVQASQPEAAASQWQHAGPGRLAQSHSTLRCISKPSLLAGQKASSTQRPALHRAPAQQGSTKRKRKDGAEQPAKLAHRQAFDTDAQQPAALPAHVDTAGKAAQIAPAAMQSRPAQLATASKACPSVKRARVATPARKATPLRSAPSNEVVDLASPEAPGATPAQLGAVQPAADKPVQAHQQSSGTQAHQPHAVIPDKRSKPVKPSPFLQGGSNACQLPAGQARGSAQARLLTGTPLEPAHKQAASDVPKADHPAAGNGQRSQTQQTSPALCVFSASTAADPAPMQAGTPEQAAGCCAPASRHHLSQSVTAKLSFSDFPAFDSPSSSELPSALQHLDDQQKSLPTDVQLHTAMQATVQHHAAQSDAACSQDAALSDPGSPCMAAPGHAEAPQQRSPPHIAAHTAVPVAASPPKTIAPMQADGPVQACRSQTDVGAQTTTQGRRMHCVPDRAARNAGVQCQLTSQHHVKVDQATSPIACLQSGPQCQHSLHEQPAQHTQAAQPQPSVVQHVEAKPAKCCRHVSGGSGSATLASPGMQQARNDSQSSGSVAANKQDTAPSSYPPAVSHDENAPLPAQAYSPSPASKQPLVQPPFGNGLRDLLQAGPKSPGARITLPHLRSPLQPLSVAEARAALPQLVHGHRQRMHDADNAVAQGVRSQQQQQPQQQQQQQLHQRSSASHESLVLSQPADSVAISVPSSLQTWPTPTLDMTLSPQSAAAVSELDTSGTTGDQQALLQHQSSSSACVWQPRGLQHLQDFLQTGKHPVHSTTQTPGPQADLTHGRTHKNNGALKIAARQEHRPRARRHSVQASTAASPVQAAGQVRPNARPLFRNAAGSKCTTALHALPAAEVATGKARMRPTSASSTSVKHSSAQSEQYSAGKANCKPATIAAAEPVHLQSAALAGTQVDMAELKGIIAEQVKTAMQEVNHDQDQRCELAMQMRRGLLLNSAVALACVRRAAGRSQLSEHVRTVPSCVALPHLRPKHSTLHCSGRGVRCSPRSNSAHACKCAVAGRSRRGAQTSWRC